MQQDSPQFQKLCFQNLLIAILQRHRRCANRQKPFYCFAETRPFYRQPQCRVVVVFNEYDYTYFMHDIAGQRSHKYRTPVAREKKPNLAPGILMFPALIPSCTAAERDPSTALPASNRARSCSSKLPKNTSAFFSAGGSISTPDALDVIDLTRLM